MEYSYSPKLLRTVFVTSWVMLSIACNAHAFPKINKHCTDNQEFEHKCLTVGFNKNEIKKIRDGFAEANTTPSEADLRLEQTWECKLIPAMRVQLVESIDHKSLAPDDFELKLHKLTPEELASKGMFSTVIEYNLEWVQNSSLVATYSPMELPVLPPSDHPMVSQIVAPEDRSKIRIAYETVVAGSLQPGFPSSLRVTNDKLYIEISFPLLFKLPEESVPFNSLTVGGYKTAAFIACKAP